MKHAVDLKPNIGYYQFKMKRKENNESNTNLIFQGKKGEKGKKFHEEGTEYTQY